jgi:hypothetical protein
VSILCAALAFVATIGLAGAQPRPAAPAGSPPEAIAAGNVLVHHWPEQQRLAAALAEVSAGATLPALPADVLHSAPQILIYITPDERRFAELTGGAVPHWGAGVAFPASGVIVIPAHRAAAGGFNAVARVLVHELAHVALHRYLEPARIPRWFTEGYATWAAGQLDFEAGWLLRVAFLTGRAPPLDSLVIGWPAGVRDARVAYLLSATVIEYLYAQGGDFALRRFLERWSEGQSMEDALFQTYGLTLAQLERQWSRSVRRRYGWTVFFSQAIVIWAIVAMLVIGLFVIRKRRDRSKLARLRADELPDVPAWWTPDTAAGEEGDTNDQDVHGDGDEAPRPG